MTLLRPIKLQAVSIGLIEFEVNPLINISACANIRYLSC